MARDQWDEAGKFAAEARAVLLRAEAEDPLAAAVAARVAIHRGDVPAARWELVNAQRLRHLLTYANPHLAVQARIELIHVHLALADLAGGRTLMGEIDEILRRRPSLGTLVGEAPPHTIKSQMKSIYRKLGSTSRTQTVTRARELGPLEG
jgi:LuxR family maltose regulon positive regulatory protein